MKTIFPKVDVLFIYGIPEKKFLRKLLHWLDQSEERYLVILEDEENALLSWDSDDERVYTCYVGSDEAMKKIALELVFLRVDYFEKCANAQKDSEKMKIAFAKMDYFQKQAFLVASDFKDRGVNLLENFLKNNERSTFFGTELFGAFPKIPAITSTAAAATGHVILLKRTSQNRFANCDWLGTALLASCVRILLANCSSGLTEANAVCSRFATAIFSASNLLQRSQSARCSGSGNNP